MQIFKGNVYLLWVTRQSYKLRISHCSVQINGDDRFLFRETKEYFKMYRLLEYHIKYKLALPTCFKILLIKIVEDYNPWMQTRRETTTMQMQHQFCFPSRPNLPYGQIVIYWQCRGRCKCIFPTHHVTKWSIYKGLTWTLLRMIHSWSWTDEAPELTRIFTLWTRCAN